MKGKGCAALGAGSRGGGACPAVAGAPATLAEPPLGVGGRPDPGVPVSGFQFHPPSPAAAVGRGWEGREDFRSVLFSTNGSFQTLHFSGFAHLPRRAPGGFSGARREHESL